MPGSLQSNSENLVCSIFWHELSLFPVPGNALDIHSTGTRLVFVSWIKLHNTCPCYQSLIHYLWHLLQRSCCCAMEIQKISCALLTSPLTQETSIKQLTECKETTYKFFSPLLPSTSELLALLQVCFLPLMTQIVAILMTAWKRPVCTDIHVPCSFEWKKGRIRENVSFCSATYKLALVEKLKKRRNMLWKRISKMKLLFILHLREKCVKEWISWTKKKSWENCLGK